MQPLLPQGEFYGEFGGLDVTLDVAADQVIGATGVPVEGEPGWGAAAAPGSAEIALPARLLPAAGGGAAGAAGRPRRAGPQTGALARRGRPPLRLDHRPRLPLRAGRRRHSASEPPSPSTCSTSPATPPGTMAWRCAARHRAAWLDSDLRRLRLAADHQRAPHRGRRHRVPDDGDERLGAARGLIAHEVGHQYVHGILANNEWREGWLDEGFTSFLTPGTCEDHGAAGRLGRSFAGLARAGAAGRTQPRRHPRRRVRRPRHLRRDDLHQGLGGLPDAARAGGEEVDAHGPAALLRPDALQHVDVADFQRAAEEVSGQDLGWFFERVVPHHRAARLRARRVATRRLADGRWLTRVEVVRAGEAWMPVELQVGGETRTLTSRERRRRWRSSPPSARARSCSTRETCCSTSTAEQPAARAECDRSTSRSVGARRRESSGSRDEHNGPSLRWRSRHGRGRERSGPSSCSTSRTTGWAPSSGTCGRGWTTPTSPSSRRGCSRCRRRSRR